MSLKGSGPVAHRIFRTKTPPNGRGLLCLNINKINIDIKNIKIYIDII